MVSEDFERIKVIGKGSYGEVWLSRHKKDKKQYVLKKMNLGKASRKERKSAEQEAKLLSKLKHPNIVSYKDSFETETGFLFIAMQYCEGGDLYARLKEQRGVPLEERQVVEWFVQIAMALQYMHERNILHRDLKTQNIFLTKSKIIKVGDLGIARVLDNASDMATTLIGTPYYMSPELFSNKPYNHKSDVWALGCCVYEMTTLKHAFNAKDMNSLVYKILKGRMPPMPRQYSADLLTLMRSMLHQDPEKRPSVNRILRDSYIKKNIAIFLEDTKKNSRRASVSSLPSSRPSSAGASRRESQPPSKLPPSSSPSSSSSSPSVPQAVSDPVPEVVTPPGRSASDGPKAKAARDETDSKPVFKKGHARKPSDSAPQDLEPIHEKRELAKSSSSDNGDSQETVVPKTVKQKSPQREPAPRKKNFLRNHINRKSDETEVNKNKNNKEEEKLLNIVDNKAKPPSGPSKASNSKVMPEPELPRLRKEDRNRPLPVPKVEESAGLPQHREDRFKDDDQVVHSGESSKSTSSKEDNGSQGDADTPRINLSARERRRQKNPNAGSMDNPHSARIKLQKKPVRAESERLTRSERAEKQEPPSVAIRPARHRLRQPSLNDSSSSSDESQKQPEREVKRENKEMNNFISLLDTTLHMNNTGGHSDEEAEELVPVEVNPREKPVRVPSPEPPEPVDDHKQIHKSVSMPSVETLTNTSRLMDRIRMLHKDCIQGVGYLNLKRAYEILDRIDEDEVEPKLVDLLGKEKFDEYAGKIWQLKFCEESLFMA